MREQAAIFCANGLGDAILMSPLAYALTSKNFQVDIYHPNAEILKSLFPNFHWKIFPKKVPSNLSNYKKIFVENDNSAFAWDLLKIRKKEKFEHIFFLFPTPCKACLIEDYTFIKGLSFTENLYRAINDYLGMDISQLRFFHPPQSTLEKDPRLIVIHPTSKDVRRNWKKSKFLTLASKLKNQNYTPVFVVSSDEYPAWKGVAKLGFDVKDFSTLDKLSGFIESASYFIGNDSGLGHIASICQVPTLTISGNHKRVQIWRPGFSTSKVALPLFPLPCFKGINFYFRERYWQYFVSVRKVLKKFNQLTHPDKKR